MNAIYSLKKYMSNIGLYGNHIDVQTGRWTGKPNSKTFSIFLNTFWWIYIGFQASTVVLVRALIHSMNIWWKDPSCWIDLSWCKSSKTLNSLSINILAKMIGIFGLAWQKVKWQFQCFNRSMHIGPACSAWLATFQMQWNPFIITIPCGSNTDFCQNSITVSSSDILQFFLLNWVILMKILILVPNSEAGANREGYPLRPGWCDRNSNHWVFSAKKKRISIF